jgi:hypothetical protein
MMKTGILAFIGALDAGHQQFRVGRIDEQRVGRLIAPAIDDVQDGSCIGRPLLNAIEEARLDIRTQSERDAFDGLAFRVLGFGRFGDAEGGEADQGAGAERRRAASICRMS